jgi:hypothetical protein
LSLLSLRTQLENAFGVTAKITDLFRNPTVADMAGFFRTRTESTDSAAGNDVSGRATRQKEFLSETAKKRRKYS